MKPPVKPQPKPGSPQPKFKPQPGYIRQTFMLTHADYHIIHQFALEKGLDEAHHSAALHLILRQWKTWRDRQHHPTLIALPPDISPTSHEKGE